jgi:hypothetical protein
VATVHDGGHNPLQGATVTGTWSGGGTGSGTCTTGSNRSCTVTRVKIRKKNGSVVYAVSNIALATYAYTPADNHGSTGVTVTKP